MNGDAGRKLDFLMKLTNTQNAMLANALNFDASYISRIRAGKRGLPLRQPFIEPASAFFARNVGEAYQRDALAKELGLPGPWPKSSKDGAKLLAAWMEGRLDSASPEAPASTAPARSLAVDAANSYPDGITAQARLFFGNQGRRAAAFAFLSQLAEAGNATSLLLQSDEDMSWLYEDVKFARDWAALMYQLATSGCRITIVHTLSRDANEMWEGVRKWLPLYMTGAVDAYYYPRLRDGVRLRSLFVAPGSSALVANSVRGTNANALSIMLHDATGVAALEEEFVAYLDLCKPLMEKIPIESPEELEELVGEFESAGDKAACTNLEGLLVIANDDIGALVAPANVPCIAFRIAEPRLVGAIVEFLNNLPGSPS